MSYLKNPTSSKTFCDALDFGSLRDPRYYAWCLQAEGVDGEENILKTHDNFLTKTADDLSNRVGGEIFLEENENNLVTISIYKRSVKSLRFKDTSQVFIKKLF